MRFQLPIFYRILHQYLLIIPVECRFMMTHSNTSSYKVCHALILYSFIALEMSKTDIDEIVLVGGTTRIPLVKQQLKCVLRSWFRCNFNFFTFYIYIFFPKFLKLLLFIFTYIFLFVIPCIRLSVFSISQAFFLPIYISLFHLIPALYLLSFAFQHPLVNN